MLNLVRWTPFGDFGPLERRFSRFFDGDYVPDAWSDAGSVAVNWKPAVDIFEDDHSIVIKAELPGVESKDVDVEVKDGVLTLKGERSHETEVKDDNYYRRERTFGKFERRFSLPEGIDAEKITADFKDGVLKIEVAKPEEHKPKKIAVHSQGLWLGPGHRKSQMQTYQSLLFHRPLRGN